VEHLQDNLVFARGKTPFGTASVGISPVTSDHIHSRYNNSYGYTETNGRHRPNSKPLSPPSPGIPTSPPPPPCRAPPRHGHAPPPPPLPTPAASSQLPPPTASSPPPPHEAIEAPQSPAPPRGSQHCRDSVRAGGLPAVARLS